MEDIKGYFRNFLNNILEFLPISSSTILEYFNLIDGRLEVGYFHLSAGLGAGIFFLPSLLRILFSPIMFFFYFFASAIPILIGFLLQYSNKLVLNFLIEDKILLNIGCGILLLVSLFFMNKNREINIMDGVELGLLSILCMFLPGISRMGISLTYLFFRGYNLNNAFRISIILSIPINICAGLYTVFFENFTVSASGLIFGIFLSFMSIIFSKLIFKFIKYIICFRIFMYIIFFMQSNTYIRSIFSKIFSHLA